MIKKVAAISGALMILALLSLFVVGTVSAQGPTPPTTGGPWGHAWGGIYNGYTIMSDAISKLLGMTPQEIYDAHAAGETLSDIAKSRGITDQQLIDAMLAGQQEAIAQAVEDGRLTQEQADWMEARMKTTLPFMLTNSFGPGARTGGFGPRGGFGPWGGTPPTTTP